MRLQAHLNKSCGIRTYQVGATALVLYSLLGKVFLLPIKSYFPTTIYPIVKQRLYRIADCSVYSRPTWLCLFFSIHFH